jgi:glycerol-1-phosphatase
VIRSLSQRVADDGLDIGHMEGLIPRIYGKDAVEIPGARRLLASLDDKNVPWAVVTSGTRNLVSGWIEVLKLAQPKTLVVAEDVENGKPDPSCYLLGHKRLNLGDDKSKLIVVEDAPSGIRAGKAAGFQVIGLATSHTLEQVREAGADWIVRDLSSVSLKAFDNGVARIAIANGLVGL